MVMILGIFTTVVGQEQPKKSVEDLSEMEIEVLKEAIKDRDNFSTLANKYSQTKADSILVSYFQMTAKVDSFYYVEMVAKEQPDQYTRNGEIYVEVLYEKKVTKRPMPANNQSFEKWYAQLKQFLNSKQVNDASK